MKRVVQIKLLPEPAQKQMLDTTLRVCNQTANEISKVARERAITAKRDLQPVVYADAKASLGGAQAVVRTIAKVADAYKTHRSNLRADRYGRRGTERRARAEVKVIEFRPHAAQPYDDRILSWRHDAREVSIWVTDTGAGKPGRIRVPFIGSPEHLKALVEHRQGESDLLCRDGLWYLVATLDLPDVEVNLTTAPDAMTTESDWLGVDLGITNIAFASNGAHWSGGAITYQRKKNQFVRRTAQAKGTRSAKRLLKKRARREARFATNTNHRISKTIVAEAQRTGRGIALEDLRGIRERARHRKPQRATFHSWSFAQLGAFIAYKAQAAGVAVVHVDPAYTSQDYHECRHRDRKNRSGEQFVCTSCGFADHADHNGSRNIAYLAPAAWSAMQRKSSKSQAVSHAADDAARVTASSGVPGAAEILV